MSAVHIPKLQQVPSTHPGIRSRPPEPRFRAFHPAASVTSMRVYWMWDTSYIRSVLLRSAFQSRASSQECLSARCRALYIHIHHHQRSHHLQSPLQTLGALRCGSKMVPARRTTPLFHHWLTRMFFVCCLLFVAVCRYLLARC